MLLTGRDAEVRGSGDDLDFDHRAGSLEDLGRLVGALEAVLHRGGWPSAARVWGPGAVTAGGVQQYRAPRRRRLSPEGLTGAQPAAAIGVPVDACIAS